MTNGVATHTNSSRIFARATPNTTEELTLDLPMFEETQNVSLQDRDLEVLNAPDFSRYFPPNPLASSNLTLDLPNFIPNEALSLSNTDPLPSIDLPVFRSFAAPHERPFDNPLNLVPIFSLYHPPLPVFHPYASISDPRFISYDTPLELTSGRPSLPLPRFKPFQSPVAIPSTFSTLSFSPFLPYIPPDHRPVSLDTITIPQLVPFRSAHSRSSVEKPLKGEVVKAEYNPVMSQFERLAKYKSYDEILQTAIRLDSLSDVRMLKHRSILGARLLRTLFDDLLREIPSHIPHSDQFEQLLENDEEEIKRLAQFCLKLTTIHDLKDLELKSHPTLSHLSILDAATQRRTLLQLKDYIYCFSSEILLQEKKAAQRFNALQKNLTPLSDALSILGAHIQDQTDTLRMETVRKLVDRDFTSWEDRIPLEIEVENLEADDIPENFDIDKGLKEIQKEKPEAYQLADFTNAVIQLPETNPRNAEKKAKYFLALAKVYYNLPKPTITALKQAIAWTDQAINTIQRHVLKDDPLYLECYEFRGAVWYRIGEFEKPLSTHENALVRKRIDIASRDFNLSVPLSTHQEQNFVRTALQSKQEPSLDAAVEKVDKAVQLDEDFAEARFVSFLKHFEKSQFDMGKLLHSHFAPLRRATATTILQIFKKCLLRKAYPPEELRKKQPLSEKATQFKVTLSSKTVVVQITPEGIALDKASKDVWVELLTHEMKKVEVIYTPHVKSYFAPMLSPEGFFEIVEPLSNHKKRLEEMEKAMQKFRLFQLAALYKSTFVIDKDELKTTTILSRLDPSLIVKLIDLQTMISQGYSRLGKRKKEHYAKALLYLCHTLANTNYLLSASSDNYELMQLKLQLLLKRAALYKQLSLWNSHTSALEEAMDYGKKINPRFLNPSLHYALGLAYVQLNRFEEAEDQFYIVEGFKKKSALAKKARVAREKVKNPKPRDDTEDAKVMNLFQEKNIQEECIQILEENAYINVIGEPNRKVACWEEFAERIRKTTTLQQLCEVVLTSVLPSKEVKADNLLRIMQLSNIALANPTDLDQIKQFLIDAIRTYKEREALLQDKVIEAHAVAKRKLEQTEAFYAFKKVLIERLKDGELIRPHSASRKKIADLVSQLPWHEGDSKFVVDALKGILGKELIPDTLVFIKEDIAEIKEHLESVLDLNLPPSVLKENVLEFTGKNIFLSEILSKILSAQSRGKFHDIHVIGVNVYIDTDLTFHGINLAIGGEYVQFMPDKKNRLITIDLSGQDASAAPLVNIPKASDARNPQETGGKGEDGNCGEGGQNGGDFCVAAATLVGLTPAVIAQINVSGGSGGAGSDGGAGGDGATSLVGPNARTTVIDGDAADSSWGHVDFRHGGKATPGSDGGQGGDAGLGGMPGLHGNIYIEEEIDQIKLLIKKDDGNQGTDGDYGAGGKGGAGEPDGLDHVIVKGGGWIFAQRKPKSGYELHCIDGRDDRNIDKWVDGITIEQMKNRNQGKSKGRGKTANEQTRTRNKQTKNDLKRQVFDSHRSKFLHTEGSAGKGYAFDAVTNRLAVARETEAALADQLAVKQRKMKDIDTLLQTTATLLSQTQSQQTTTTQHTRVATFSKKEKKINQRREILAYLKHPGHDSTNALPFQDCSPVKRTNDTDVHPLEYALHAVNMTKGRHMPSIGTLLQEVVSYAQDPDCIEDKLKALLKKIQLLIEMAPLKYASEGFNELAQAVQPLIGIGSIKQAIAVKKPQVEKFLQIVETEKQKVGKAYRVKISELSIRAAVIHFLKTDRLLFNLQVTLPGLCPPCLQEKAKKEKWFNQRLRQRIIEIIKNAAQREPLPGEVDNLIKFAKEKRVLVSEALQKAWILSDIIHFFKTEPSIFDYLVNPSEEESFNELLRQKITKLIRATSYREPLSGEVAEFVKLAYEKKGIVVRALEEMARQPMYRGQPLECAGKFLTFARENRAFVGEILENEKFRHPYKLTEKVLDKHRDDIRGEVKLLKQNRDWIFRHLLELVEADILPSMQGVAIQELYNICCQKWANSPSFETSEEKTEPVPEQEQLSPSRKRQKIDQISQQNWTPEKKAKLESHIKQLTELNLGDDFLIELKRLYNLTDGLAEIFVLYVLRHTKERIILDGWKALVTKLLSFDLSIIYKQRQRFAETQKSEDEELYKAICHFLRQRHISCVQQECYQLFRGRNDRDKITPSLDAFITKASSLEILLDFLPKVDILNKAGEVVRLYEKELCLKFDLERLVLHLTETIRQLPQDHAKITDETLHFSEDFVTKSINLTAPQMSAILKTIIQKAIAVCNDPNTKPPVALSDAAFSLIPTVLEEHFQQYSVGDIHFDLFNALLSRLVAPILGAVEPTATEALLNRFKTTIHAHDYEKAGACLFLLMNLELSFEKGADLLETLEQLPQSDAPIVKSGKTLLTQKLHLQREQFDAQWEATLQRARIFDQFRKQLNKDDQTSIEKTLYQIADLANLLSSDEKIPILNKIITILSREGCFSSLYYLQLLQLQVIKKLGTFDPPLHSIKVGYNTAFSKAFENIDGDKTPLSALFMQVVRSFGCTEAYLTPAWIAINHLEWDPQDLIQLYRWIEACESTNKEKVALKEQCLDRIRQLLIEHLQKRHQEHLEKQKSVSQRLFKKQTELVEQIGSIIKNTTVFSPDHQIAKFQLWLKMLDQHYELDTFEDEDGTKRETHYKAAYDCFLEKMKIQDTQKGMDEFNAWLGTEYNSLKKTPADLKLFDQLVNPSDTVRRTLNRLYWRGAITYKQALDQIKDELKDEIATRLYLKLDDSMIHEEYSEIKKMMEKEQEAYEKQLAEWIKHISSSLTSGEKIAQAFPDKKTLKEAIKSRKIPDFFSVQKRSSLPVDLSFEEWLHALFQKEDLSLFEKNVSKLDAYLKDLSERIADEEVDEDDASIIKLFKSLVEKWRDSKAAVYKATIEKIEKQLIDLEDLKEKRKDDKINEFLGLVKGSLKNRTAFHEKQNKKDLEKLTNALNSCAVLLGEGPFLTLLENCIQQWAKDHENLTLTSLIHFFWVAPRVNDFGSLFEVMDHKLPENWTMTLLELHCFELFSPMLSRMAVELPPLNLSKLKDSQKDDEINKVLEQNKKRVDLCFAAFKNCLAAIQKSPLRASEKEILFRLIAERLSLLNQGKLEFSIEEFTTLLSKYLSDPKVIEKLSAELSKKHSVIANILFVPSFQGFKYSLTLAWIEASLGEPIQRLNKADRQKIYDSLLQIETIKKEEMMRSVVDALKGDVMTPAVAECVAHFADGTWELDETSLRHLKERTDSGAWYDKIENHTKAVRSKPRTLEILAEIMAKESTGINSAIKELITGSHPEIVEIIKKIQAKFRDGIKDWSESDIKEWAKEKKSEAFLDDPERLMEGIAVVSRAYQLFHPDKHTLRETQMIALWLMLRPAKGVERGRISQMFTGEGKSITFASLAILRAMTKSYVDLVTTSFVLAQRDAEEFADLFKMFDLTVSNNCDEECEKEEEVRKTRYFRDKKPVDIVYGDVGAFERDLLLTEFHGQEIIHTERMGSNRTVLIDEVDGLFLDNAGMVLYLSHNVDTLRFLERVLGQIWALANHPSFEQARTSDEKTVEEICKLIQEKIEAKEIPLPSYQMTHARYVEMKAIIHRKLPIWTRSALHAKKLRVNDEYIITDQTYGKKKKKTITVMDKGTGVEQYSLKWSNGLHQFLQFKHGLELTPESLKAVFLSNYFFFKRYGQHIYGLSGTLGSDTEQKYLQDLYQVDLAKIPRFKGEKYIKYKDSVTGDQEEWVKRVQTAVDREIKEKKRAVLIICDSVAEVMILQNQFKKEYPLLHVYTSTTQTEEISFFAHDNPTKVAPGDLIIATNLAGRGTDLKTSSALEDNGGLHVIMSYLPPNIRIQEQGFGRTARAGNEGSGELILMDPHRRPISELCRLRDMEEKQRLENVAIREIKKIEFENQLLRGFVHNGEKIEGFQDLLEWVKKELQNEEKFYREAQINSLKNRWAFWIDHMDEKITIVHAIGKENVIASFKEFCKGIREDFKEGGFRLIKEPAELIKLGREYRLKEKWSDTEECYKKAAEDAHYKYALYYMAACRLKKAPSSSRDAKLDFQRNAKKAILAIKTEIAQLQATLQAVNPIAEQTRTKQGAADYGNPYKARTEERIQIWSIFLTAIDEALGGTLTEQSIKKSQYGENAAEILKSLGPRYRADAKLSKKLVFHDDKVVYDNPGLEAHKEFTVPKMLRPVLPRLKGMKEITKETLKDECEATLLTREKAKDKLRCPSVTVYKFAPLPSGFEWPSGYAENVQFVLSTIIEELRLDTYSTPAEMKQKLKEKTVGNKLLEKEKINPDDLFQKIEAAPKLILKDYQLDLRDYVDAKFEKESTKELQLSDLKKGFKARFHQLEPALQEALFAACRQRESKDGKYVWSLKTTIHLSELSLPTDANEGAELIWNLFEEQDVIKVPKVKLQKKHVIQAPFAPPGTTIEDSKGHFIEQLEGIKSTIETLFDKHPDKDKAVASIYEIIDSSVGMIYKLEDKKTTAKFADIIRKYYHDHQQHAPEGLGEFIELGLEVIADLIEKKDPPAWFEVVAVTLLGVIQMVAGVIIKAYLPIVGDLIGNALISSGMDDVVFAIDSAITGEFSWSDYGAHKVASLKNSLISSALSCGISFGVDAIGSGVGNAWQTQKLSGVEKMAKAGQIASSSSFNLGSHITKEIGRNFIQMGISQVASRGLQGMTQLIAASYAKDIQKEVEKAVNEHWATVVVPQANALFDKLDGDQTAQTKIKGCIDSLLKSSRQGGTFDSVIRGSRQVLPQARNMIKNSGWGTFVSSAPDIVNLGVSMFKLNSLIKDKVHELARDIRATNDRNTTPTKSTNKMSKTAFDAQLEKMKADYAKELHDLFTTVLNSAVYAPLVSLGTKALVDAGSGIIPMTEQEAIAESRETISEIIEAENNLDEAFYDKAKSHWGDANEEVTTPTNEQLQQTPVNASESIETLKEQYGSLLKVYKDKDGHLYVQRPTRADYIKGIQEGKASGDPEIAALAKVAGKKIAIIDPDGKVKTFSVDANGKVTTQVSQDNSARTADTIYLKYEPNTATGIGHVTVENAAPGSGPSFFDGKDCLYNAVNQAAGLNRTPEDLRKTTANTLKEGEGFRQFYHDWSLSSEPKQFAGSVPYNIGTRLGAMMRGGFALGEFALGAGLTFESGGAAAAIGIPIMLDSADNLNAAWKSFVTGQPVDTMKTQMLQSGLNLTHEQAQLGSDFIEMAASLGGSWTKVASRGLKFETLTLTDLAKAKPATFIAGETGGALPLDLKTCQAMLEKLAVSKEVLTFKEGAKVGQKKGIKYFLKDGSVARVMEPNGPNRLRVVFEKVNKQKIDPFTGLHPKPPPGVKGKAASNFAMERSHFDLRY